MTLKPFAEEKDREILRCYEQFVRQLSYQNYALVDDFLAPEWRQALRARIDYLRSEGAMHKAGIGKLQDFERNEAIRGDQIFWLDQNPTHQESQQLVTLIDGLMQYVNRNCFLGLKSFETHLTAYPPGTFYKRHKDRFRQLSHRILSLVIYLNDDWHVEDGGQLILYDQGNTIEIVPIAGRAILFLSDMEHEVKLCHKRRYSATSWMLDTLPGTTFL